MVADAVWSILTVMTGTFFMVCALIIGLEGLRKD